MAWPCWRWESVSLIARSFRKLYKWKLLHWAALIMTPSGILAVIAGWVTTEVGRQPYTIYKLLRTTESASPLDAPAVASSLAAFAVVYFIVFGAGMFYVLRLMGQLPHAHESGLKPAHRRAAPASRPHRPWPPKKKKGS